MSEALEPTMITAELRTATLPRTVRCVAEVGSTMDVARELLTQLPASSLPLLVTAELQTMGRGRLGRRWEAPAGTALLCSLAFRPSWLAPEQAVALVWMTAVSLCEAVAATTSLRPSLKWPNDLMLPLRRVGADGLAGRGKAAGIILETSMGARGLEWAIIGCGVNVSSAPPPEATRYPATSLAAAGSSVSRLELLQTLLRRLDHWHEALRAGRERELFEAWRGWLGGIGEPTLVTTASGAITGVAEGVADSGALLLRDAQGTLHTISSGDVGLVDQRQQIQDL